MKVDKADWRTKASLKPGDKGTAKHYDKYGDDLICVRYRYDEKSRKRITTVELIVDTVTLPPKVEALNIKVKRYACRDFNKHPKSITTCVNCGWPKVNHKQFQK